MEGGFSGFRRRKRSDPSAELIGLRTLAQPERLLREAPVAKRFRDLAEREEDFTKRPVAESHADGILLAPQGRGGRPVIRGNGTKVALMVAKQSQLVEGVLRPDTEAVCGFEFGSFSKVFFKGGKIASDGRCRGADVQHERPLEGSGVDSQSRTQPSIEGCAVASGKSLSQQPERKRLIHGGALARKFSVTGTR